MSPGLGRRGEVLNSSWPLSGLGLWVDFISYESQNFISLNGSEFRSLTCVEGASWIPMRKKLLTNNRTENPWFGSTLGLNVTP